MRKILHCLLILYLVCANSVYALQKGNAKPGETISIDPGKTTKSYVSDKLGEPYLIKTIDGKECWFFESGDNKTQPFLVNEKTVIFIQFNDKGIVEDNYSTTESGIPHIKTKSLEQVLKEKKEEEEKDARWRQNRNTYGKPDQESRDGTGETWYYIISKEPTDKKDTNKVKMKAIRFDKSGNFVKEWMTNAVLFERALTSEEQSNFDGDSILKEARLQTREAVRDLVIGDANAAYKQGSDLNDAKRYDKAIPWFKRALELNPKLAMAHLGLAFAYQNTNQRDLSIQSYENFIELDPTYMAAYLNLSAQYMLKNDIYKAYKCLKMAQTYNQNDNTVNNAIKALEGRYGVALAVSEQVEKDKSHSQVIQAGNLVYVGPSYYKEGQVPITSTEQKVFDEYNSFIKELEKTKPLEAEGRKMVQEKFISLANKYNMTQQNLTLLLLKIAYREIPPDTYVPPSENPIDTNDVNKDKYEAMTPEERTAVVKDWNAETDSEKLQQKALTAEARGDYKNAMNSYKEILTLKEIQDDLVPMIHSGLQRCYEKLKDATNEKTELTWINDYVLAPAGKYNHMVKYFTNTVKNYLRERMARYGIKPN